ncbi:unnamed protein product [Boreogadus saida]
MGRKVPLWLRSVRAGRRVADEEPGAQRKPPSKFMASDQTSDIGSAAAEDGVKDPLPSLRHPSLSTRCPSRAPYAPTLAFHRHILNLPCVMCVMCGVKRVYKSLTCPDKLPATTLAPPSIIPLVSAEPRQNALM